MKRTLLFTLLTALALSACQNEKTPQAQAPAEPAAAASEQPAQSPSQTQASSSQSDKLPAKSAVAVTKPQASAASSIRTAMKPSDLAQAVKKTPDQPSVAATAARETVKTAVSTGAARVKHAAEKPAKAIKTAVKKAVKPAAPVMTKPAAAPAAVAVAGDAVRGRQIARKCQACHNFTDKKKVGPGLKGVFGRKAGIMPDMRYSKALKAGGWVWNEKNLHMWDCDSRKAIKVLSGNPSAKTKMPPQHICDAAKLADLTAFLKTL